MPKKFRNKYRIASARMPGWDYSSDGAYFITICTAHRVCMFGSIHNAQIALSAIGQIVQQEWEKSFVIRAELFCDSFVIMPNHIHAILRIDNVDNTVDATVETHGRASLRINGIAVRSPKSISSFVAGFKSAATKQINELRRMPGAPVWQTRFHDHVIRNNDEYVRINHYIINNPANWVNDCFFIEKFNDIPNGSTNDIPHLQTNENY